MSALKINKPNNIHDFKAGFYYDSRKNQFPIGFSGIQLFLNDDTQPLCDLFIDDKKEWTESVDLKPLIPPGKYTFNVKTTLAANCSSVFSLLVNGKIYLAPYFPQPPFHPFLNRKSRPSGFDKSIWDAIKKSHIPPPPIMEFFWDAWEVEVTEN